jgi:hypothetical protein
MGQEIYVAPFKKVGYSHIVMMLEPADRLPRTGGHVPDGSRRSIMIISNRKYKNISGRSSGAGGPSHLVEYELHTEIYLFRYGGVLHVSVERRHANDR